jgi:hypothetical protein
MNSHGYLTLLHDTLAREHEGKPVATLGSFASMPSSVASVKLTNVISPKTQSFNI